MDDQELMPSMRSESSSVRHCQGPSSQRRPCDHSSADCAWIEVWVWREKQSTHCKFGIVHQPVGGIRRQDLRRH